MSDYEGAKCSSKHPIRLIDEGHGICGDEANGYWSWSLVPTDKGWPDYIIGRNGERIPARCMTWQYEYEDCLAALLNHIASIRAMPFDEEAERARLMPV